MARPVPKPSESHSACAPRRAAVSPRRPRRPRDLRRRAVLEEVEHREHRQRGGGDAEGGELRPAEVADDGGVDEDVERLRCERAERGNRKAEDLAVVR